MISTMKRMAIAFLALSFPFAVTGCSTNFMELLSKKPEAKKVLNANTLVYRLEDLNNRTADHSTPDAIVYIAPGYDASKSMNLFVYNHGMMTNLEDVERDWQLAKCVKEAPPNTVVVAPEWAVNPKNLSSNAGQFHKPGFFRDMLTEVFSKVPELRQRSIDKDVSSITLASFSGGLYPLASELNRNGIEDKVKRVVLFDSLYKTGVLDGWLKKNINQLASGEKEFYNFYFHTYPRAIPQAKLVKNLLTANKLDPSKCMRWDTDDPNTVMSAERIARRPIVFKYGIHGDEKISGHNAVPLYYLPELMKALTLKEQGALVAAKESAKPI